jgi:NAD(P)H-flavin reductase
MDAQVTVDRAAEGWTGEVGVVTRLIPKAGFDPQDCIAMICGPEVMMRFTVTELQKLGVPDERIFVSMERNMKCAVSLCGHCQLGPYFICKDGPVFPYSRLKDWFWRKEV